MKVTMEDYGVREILQRNPYFTIEVSKGIKDQRVILGRIFQGETTR
jgi:hypothetical protein